MNRDYLIIGAGISGSLLARALAKRGCHVLLLSSPQVPGASAAAAWMMNPITGLRFSNSWRIETLLPHAFHTYGELEKESGLTLLHPQSILRYLKSESERARVLKKGADPLFTASTLFHPRPTQPDLLNSHGCLEIRGGGWVDLNPWLSFFQKHPGPRIEVISEHLLPEDLVVEKNRVLWKGRSFSQALFCTGYSHWPWFEWLPWKAAKGETLVVRIAGLNLKEIIKKDLFILPLGEDLYRIGATYSWSVLNHQATESARSELLHGLSQMTTRAVEVISHQAAVRPSFQGTVPALGLHPRYPSLGLLNGLGSKGSLSAPWLSEHFASHLVEKTPLDPEIDLCRNF
jgi:glycine oxidase